MLQPAAAVRRDWGYLAYGRAHIEVADASRRTRCFFAPQAAPRWIDSMAARVKNKSDVGR